MLPVPRWFIPQGVDRPAHLPPGAMGVTTGPDTDGPERPSAGGIMVGGPYVRGEPGWWRTDAGWWHHLSGTQPNQYLRLSPFAGQVLTDANDRQWLIPTLLRPAAGGFRCALPQTLTSTGFVPPAAHRDLLDRLRGLMLPALGEIAEARQHGRSPVIEIDDGALAKLAIEIIAVNYHLSSDEIIDRQWLTDTFGALVMIAACGLMTLMEVPTTESEPEAHRSNG